MILKLMREYPASRKASFTNKAVNSPNPTFQKKRRGPNPGQIHTCTGSSPFTIEESKSGSDTVHV